MKNFALTLATRHLRTGGTQTWLIIGGVGVAVALVIFVSGLINGVQQRIVNVVTGSLPHVVVTAEEEEPRTPAQLPGVGDAVIVGSVRERPTQRTTLDQWRSLQDTLVSFPHVVTVSPTVTGQAIISFAGQDASVRVEGAIPTVQEQVTHLAQYLVVGEFLTLDANEAVIGYELADSLGIALGDRIRVTTAIGETATVRIRGIVNTGQPNVDDGWMFVPLRTAQALFGAGTAITAFFISLDDLFAANDVADLIEASLGLEASSWMREYSQILTAFRAQTATSWLISTFSLLAAGFAISSVLIVSVLKRSKEIGILKSMGARGRQILLVFTLEGLGIAIIGAALGVVFGSGLIVVLRAIPQPVRVPGQQPEALLPGVVTPGIVIITVIAALLITVIASVLPARQAARLDPVEVIRRG
jgi:lipoprotein-releasing system permease protein